MVGVGSHGGFSFFGLVSKEEELAYHGFVLMLRVGFRS
jgi:hypothetical protein